MPRLRRTASVALAAATLTLLALSSSVSGAAGGGRAVSRAGFLGLAQAGIAAAHRSFWKTDLRWDHDSLPPPKSAGMPLAYLWSAFPLFEAIDAVAIADPTPANRAAVGRFAA